MEIAIFILFAAIVIASIIYASIAARKRREAMFELSTRLGFQFTSEKDYSLAKQYEFLNRLAQGDNRYAYNILSGAYQQHSILAFDYHYQTYSTDSKGNRQTDHHHFSCFILRLPRIFPELVITREGLFSKIAQAFGYDDIDFESAEFSRKFCVRSKDKRFAYDVCNAQMMEYLLANDDLNIEIERDALAIAFPSCLDAPKIETNLRRLLEIRLRMPEYLFTTTS